MKIRLMLLPGALITSLGVAEPVKTPVTQVPKRSTVSVKIDGQIGSEEWDGAHELKIAPDVTLLIFHTKDSVHLAVRLRTDSPSYVDLFLLLNDEKPINLHASMQVGERKLPRAGWTDRDPPTHWGRQDRWKANSVKEVPGKPASAPLRETIVPYDGFEFLLSKDRFGRRDWRLRLEVRDFAGERKDIVFPNPSSRMDASSWAEFSFSE